MAASVRPAIRAALLAVAVAFGATGAGAIEGGSAGRAGDRLARSTVGIGTVVDREAGLGISRCSGILIAPDLVLTAAHCVRNDPLAARVVFYDGSGPVAPTYQVASVIRRDIDPGDIAGEYGAAVRELSLDTAVLRLASPVAARPPLPVGSVDRRIPKRLRLAGVGLSSRGMGRLKTAALEPIAVSGTGLIVARAIGALVCSGDSGGPVVAEGRRGPVLWGVASAVLTRTPPCGGIVVVAPVSPVIGN